MTPIEIIKSSLLKDRLSHLYLLVGNQGDYRDQMLLEMIQLLVGDNASSKLALIEKQKVMWVESETQVIKKDQIQQLFLEFSKTSLQNQRKVYVIEDAEKMNASAANTILKFMEEPESKSSIGILVTHNQQALLDTIVSRSHLLKMIEPSINQKKELFQTLDIHPLELDIYAIIAQNSKDVSNAMDNPLIQEMINLFKHMIYERHHQQFMYELYELSACLDDKLILIAFIQILIRFFTDVRTQSSHIHFSSIEDEIKKIAEEVDGIQLDETIDTMKELLKQMRYFVQTELQKRHVLHLIKNIF